MFRYVLVHFVCLCLCFGGALPAWAFEFPETVARQAIVIDYDTGAVLFEKNAHTRMPTSSMSKVLTVYEVFQALKRGDIDLSTPLSVSEKAWKKGGSKMFVKVDTSVAVEDLLRGVVVQSGNDATIVLAEGLAGSEEGFAERLNETAQAIGMKDSHFVNASGWPDDNHYSTAYDLALLGAATIRDFPEYYHYYAEHDFTYNDIKQPNRNPLLYRGIGADGIKTGHTEVGGYGLIGSGKRDGRRVIVVVNGLEDETARAQESARLLEWGLAQFETKTLYKAGDNVAVATVDMGKEISVNAYTQSDLVFVTPKREEEALKATPVFNEGLTAPVKKDQMIGVLKVEIAGQPEYKTPLYAANDVEELGFISKLFVKTKRFVAGFVVGKTTDILNKTIQQEDSAHE